MVVRCEAGPQASQELAVTLLQEGEGVADDSAQLVLIALVNYLAAQTGMTQGQINAPQSAILQPVVEAQIPFPLTVSTANRNTHIVTAQAGGRGLEAR